MRIEVCNHNRTMVKREISNTLMSIKEDRKISYAKVADMIDQSTTEVYHYLNGDYCMKLYKLVQLCVLLNMTPNEFLNWDRLKREVDKDDLF